MVIQTSDQFFQQVTNFQSIDTASGPITVPILYLDASAMWVYFSAPIHKVQSILPSNRLKPISLGNGKALYGVVCFEYRETAIGSYNEVGIGAPCRLDPLINIPLLPAFFDRFFGVGFYVQYLPVTTQIAYDAGVDIWGLPKFLADITFEEARSGRRCLLHADSTEILTLEVSLPDRALKQDTYDFHTFSVKDQSLLKTPVQTVGQFWASRNAKSAQLHLGTHPVAEQIRKLQVDTKPLKTIIYPTTQIILHAASDRYTL
jgi:hypothetical protein